MTVGPRGYEATQARMNEILSRIRTMRPEVQAAAPQPTPSPMQGVIGDGNAPFDPFGSQATMTRNRVPGGVSDMIQSAASKAGIDHILFESLVQAESDFDQNATSGAGAIGLAQLMPGTAKALGVNPHDPVQNLEGGARYLAGLLKQFNGDERLALAGYNAGPGAVKRYNGIPPFKETRNYVDRIMTRVGSLRGTP